MITLFTWVAWISTAVFGLFLLMMLVGGVSHSLDFDIDGDGMPDGHDFSGFKILTVQGLAAFGMGLGWSGRAFLVELGWKLWPTMIVSSVIGFAMLILMAVIMRQLKKLDETPVRDLNACVGKTAIAYTPFYRNAVGKVEVTLNGRKQILDARNEGTKEISSFETILVTNLGSDGMLKVSAFEKELN